MNITKILNNKLKDDLVFIITRHVTNEQTNKYWKECYKSIRKFYPDIKIIIIDDNSSYKNDNYNTTNCDIINSEFPQRGELLPYYYLHKYEFAKKAIIIHDSVFINKKIEIDNINTYKFLWDGGHKWDNELNLEETTLNILDKYDNINIINFYNNKQKWKTCFGAMTVITLEFIKKIHDNFNLNLLLDNINTRRTRMSFERIIACLCAYNDVYHKPEFGHIIHWCMSVTNNTKKFNISYEDYINNKQHYKQFPIMKVWSGR